MPDPPLGKILRAHEGEFVVTFDYRRIAAAATIPYLPQGELDGFYYTNGSKLVFTSDWVVPYRESTYIPYLAPAYDRGRIGEFGRRFVEHEVEITRAAHAGDARGRIVEPDFVLATNPRRVQPIALDRGCRADRRFARLAHRSSPDAPSTSRARRSRWWFGSPSSSSELRARLK